MSFNTYDRLTTIVVPSHMRELRQREDICIEEHRGVQSSRWTIPNRAVLNIEPEAGQSGIKYDIEYLGEEAEPIFHPQLYNKNHVDTVIQIGRVISRNLLVDISRTLPTDTLEHVASHNWFNNQPYPHSPDRITRTQLAMAFARPEIESIEQMENFRL